MNFKVQHTEVIIVGSAKLGFSIAPHKRYRYFNDKSDIDIAICSPTLYDDFWKDVFCYWDSGERWPNLDQFCKYHFRGWIRPDKLPKARSFQRAQDWWDFFRYLSSSRRFGPYKLSCALYKDLTYLERYQAKCIRECKNQELGNI